MSTLGGVRVFKVVLHALAGDSIEECAVIILFITHHTVQGGTAILTGVVAVFALIIFGVLIVVVSTHVLAHVGSQIEEVIPCWALPSLHVENHGTHPLQTKLKQMRLRS